jgi:predicted permease
VVRAFRTLRRTPAFTATAILTLVLGIGSVAAMFSIVHGVLLAPLPYPDAGRLVSISLTMRAPELRRIEAPLAAYSAYTRFTRRLENVGFYRTGSGNIAGDPSNETERVTATWVTASTFATLGVPPLMGRWISAGENEPNGLSSAVLSESLWRSRFRGARDVVGTIVYINNVPRTIVGVMPDGFQFPSPATRVWLPARFDADRSVVTDFSYSAVGRLPDGVTTVEAQHELASVLPRLAELSPRMESGVSTSDWLAQSKPSPSVISLRDDVTAGIAKTLWILSAAAALVLIVACANVANLMLVRADSRQVELAVRQALGASRLQILLHFLGESVVLAATSAAAALAMAWGAVRALVAFGPADVPRLGELAIGPAAIGFTLLVAGATAVFCSVVPAFRARPSSLSINLREGGRTGTAGKARQRLRGMMAALQIAGALVVLATSLLLLRTFAKLSRVQPGFDGANVVTFWTQLPFRGYGADSSAVNFYGRLVASVAGLPGVRAAGVTSRLPMGSGESIQRSFRIDDGRTISVPTFVVDDGYLKAMGIPLLAGRAFGRIGEQRDGEVIISQRAAVTLWHDSTGRSALGKQIRSVPAGPPYTVIGVAGDVRYADLADSPAADFYVPQAVAIDAGNEPSARHTLALVVKTTGPPSAIVTPVRRIVRDLEPRVATFDVRTMDEVVAASTARLSLTLVLMSAAAVITLALGAIGLYGVTAYMVALRTRELGLRVALGADPRRLARTVASKGLVLIAVGVGVGLLLFAGVSQFLRSFLYDVSPGDPLTLAVATLGLVLTASLANWVPARRAARVDPAETLRAE